jgi:putative chitinase
VTTPRKPSAPVRGIDRAVFFAAVRKSVFGRLKQAQVDGMTRILAYREEKWPRVPDAELAYILATVYHETAREMQPIREKGSIAYLSSKNYFPWYGRGLVQVTWKSNYAKWNIHNADDALQWDVSLRVLFEGMIKGMFTGKKLSDYIGPRHADYVGARRIVNGTDKASLIAGYANAFQDALEDARVAGPSPDFHTTDVETKETVMPPFVGKVLDMVVGNPLTGIPGAIGVCALLGPFLHALGDALIEIGQGVSIWTVAGNFMTKPEVSTFGASIGLLAAKDHNKTGITQR